MTNLYGGLDCHIVELPRLPCRRSRVRWSFCDRYKQCDGVSKAKAAIRRTIVKRLTPCVERRMGSSGKQILCKLFAAQKSAKIDAWGMRRSKTKGHLMYCFLAFAREQYVQFFHNSRPCKSFASGSFAPTPHMCPKLYPHSCPKKIPYFSSSIFLITRKGNRSM